jgi:molybdenum cofactor guanylyltransferase
MGRGNKGEGLSGSMTHQAQSVEACILAGGLSSRMGREKARLKVAGRSLLTHVRRAAMEAGFPVRVIRRDLVSRCGPLGGVYSALSTTQAEVVVFLACDMPFVSVSLLKQLLRALKPKTLAVFTGRKTLGFPFVLRRAALGKLEPLLPEGPYSLQALAGHLRAKALPPTRGQGTALFNINTPADYQRAESLWKRLNLPGALPRSAPLRSG